MGPIRQRFSQGDVDGCRNYIQTLWAARRDGQLFTASDADDAVWILNKTQGNEALQRQLWPKLLGLLTRWALLAVRASPSGSAGPAAGSSVPFLQALQRWIAARLTATAPSWAVRAPALLLVATVGTTASQGAGPPQPPSYSPLQLSYQALRTELQRRPSADLLVDSPGAVTDLCTAVELVLERLTVSGDWQAFVTLLETLLTALSGVISDLCSRVGTAAAVAQATTRQPPPQSSDARRLAAALTVAALQEAAVAALAALHASCRQLGTACARAAAAAANAGTSSPGPGAAAAAAAGTAGRAVSGAAAAAGGRTATGQVNSRPAAIEALATLAEHVHAAAAAAAAAMAAGPAAPGRGTAASLTLSVTDPWATLSVAAAAAGGLLDGCVLTVRLQPLERPQELLMRLLQPAVDTLSRTLQEAAASAAAAGALASAALAGSTPAGGGGCCFSICSIDADPRVLMLNVAVGYCWARLRAQGPLQPALRAAEQMVAAAATATATAASAVAAVIATGAHGGGCWHPCRGALAALLLGSLGVGRVLQLAVEGGAPSAAAELLEDHSLEPLFADIQLLAKGVVEALRGAPPAAPAPEPAATLASALLSDAATAAKRLHLLYGGVADDAAGRAGLAALPPAATGPLRELLDRAFVCEVSILAAAYDGRVAAAASLAAAGGAGAAARVAEAMAPVAAVALGALADLQFCALQLRAHGDLVARLSADALAAPAAALSPLLSLLPCYPAFAASYGGKEGSGVGFAAAPVAASRLAFLLPLAASCVPHAADVGAAASAVLPYTYLLFKSAPESVLQAAHSTWAALLAGLCESAGHAGAEAEAEAGGARGGGGGRLDLTQRGGGRREGPRPRDDDNDDSDEARLAVAASMVPYYIERTCQQPCSVSDLELLEWGVRQVLKSLPGAHPMKAWCTARLARQLADWGCDDGGAAAAAAAATATAGADGTATGQRRRDAARGAAAPPYGRDSAPPSSPLADAATAASGLVRRCAALVGVAVSEVDFPLLPSALDALDVALRGLRPGVAASIVQELHAVWLSCNDYARKQLLDTWLQQALVRSRLVARL